MLLIISLIVFLPTLGALVIAFMPSKKDENGVNDKENQNLLLGATLVVGILTFLLTVVAFLFVGESKFSVEVASMQHAFSVDWIPSFDIAYAMGIDGISFPLILLTTGVSILAILASWSIKKHVKAYCILFLLLETGMIGVFLALDFFLFYVFWEVMLLPMYFLIGIWGGPRREYAAIKFFLYTLLGSVLMLIAILMIYFNSDLRLLDTAIRSDLINQNVISASVAETVANATEPVHTFNLVALAELAQTTDCFSAELQWWCFLLLFIGFIVKVPSIPVHTWLPDAHVEAPTPISMILAGVLLKLGGYGIIRICYPICPAGGLELSYLVVGLGVVSMVYGAFAALAQTDFKRVVAYSSVSHMGYVVVGFGVWTMLGNGDYWRMGITGAMYQMIGHGISSAGMFFMVGIIYDRVHHRNLDEFGGLYGLMPKYTALAMGLFFAGLGLPGLCGFIGEVLVVLSVWRFSPLLAIISASVVIFTAGYILWTIQRVYLGSEYKGPHAEEIRPVNSREFSTGAILLALAIFFGVFPNTLIKFMDKTVDKQVTSLNEWRLVYEDDLAQAEQTEEADQLAPEQDDDSDQLEQAHSEDETVGMVKHLGVVLINKLADQ
ncbi:MAG: NADH-quinone oxidoreductase subunit M [Planctomycetaceae bacterium]|mgnify:CR=1 FL=1|nr:NADH-quinone oxidoreductase subunit M [Planctomycetaceae bacterium]|tara:strand:+ start:2450 stop:4273 length:1824 start_codon:yes stop_codon:yes gene_type:complete